MLAAAERATNRLRVCSHQQPAPRELSHAIVFAPCPPRRPACCARVDNLWHHVAVSWAWDSGEVRLYLDGQEKVPFWASRGGQIEVGGVSCCAARRCAALRGAGWCKAPMPSPAPCCLPAVCPNQRTCTDMSRLSAPLHSVPLQPPPCTHTLHCRSSLQPGVGLTGASLPAPPAQPTAPWCWARCRTATVGLTACRPACRAGRPPACPSGRPALQSHPSHQLLQLTTCRASHCTCPAAGGCFSPQFALHGDMAMKHAVVGFYG